MQNKFGEVIHSIPELAADHDIMLYISRSLRNLFEYLGFEGPGLEAILKRTLSAFDEEALKRNSRPRGAETEYDLPESLLKFYDEVGFREKRKKRVQGRAKAMYSLISPHLVRGETTLDIGTGNASIALAIHNAGYAVHAMDITDNRSPAAKEKEAEGLEFQLHTEGEPLRYPANSYDNCILAAILHHCDDPMGRFNEAMRVTRKRFFIYESTFGVTAKDMPPGLIASNPEMYEAYLGLSREQKKMYGTFLDWFLNKIEFRNDAHVPCNFTSPDRWDKISTGKGLSIVEKRILGFDNPGISEFHIFYALEK